MKIFIAQTIDGFIAGPRGSLDHLVPFQGNDYGYDAFIKTVDSVVIGRRTFDAIYPRHGWTYPSRLPGVVVTSRPLPKDLPTNVIGSTDLNGIALTFRDAFLDGGAMTIRSFLGRGLITSARIFTLPIFLGAGTRLFPDGPCPPGPWTFHQSRSFPCGTVMHHYSA
ncbi:MAG: dihydrofolate reductase family protein [Rhodobacterales bacterium]|nr:dihydrofolate reductase family protein [Rhodobacterales bacterium]